MKIKNPDLRQGFCDASQDYSHLKNFRVMTFPKTSQPAIMPSLQRPPIGTPNTMSLNICIEWGEGKGLAYWLEPGGERGYRQEHLGEENHRHIDYQGSMRRPSGISDGTAQGEEGDYTEKRYLD